MGRVRTFDYEEARRLRAQGVSLRDIADYLGVGYSRIAQVTRPDYEREEAERRARAHANCQQVCHYCGGLATWNRYSQRSHSVPRCRACYWQQRRASYVSPYARDDALYCSSCEQWLPDEAFPKRSENRVRRGRHGWCRDCNTAARFRSREARKVPCRLCGQPRTHPKDAGAKASDTGLCKTCYQDAVRTRELSAA